MATLINGPRIGNLISERLGIGFSATIGEKDEYPLLVIRPTDLNKPKGFSVETHFGWKSVVVTFLPDNYASELLMHMSNPEPDKIPLLNAFSTSIRNGGSKLSIRVNNEPKDLITAEWPERPWKNLQIVMEKMGFSLEDHSIDPAEKILELLTPYFGLLATLLPTENKESYLAFNEPGLPEGAKIRVEVNRYERSRINREACLSLFGTRCQTCGIDLGEKYGSLGHGYIHVHHVVPVSKLGDGYIIDPSKDLIPVCPNCHAMLHQKDPPLGIDELRNITGHHP